MFKLKEEGRIPLTRFLAFLLIIFIMLSSMPILVLAQSKNKFYSGRTESSEEALFECNTYDGWKGYRTADHWTYDNSGKKYVAYCLQHKYDPPVGNEEYKIVNGANYYDKETLKGLQIIAAYGYPNEKGGFSDREARYATCSAIRWWIAEQEDKGAFNEPDAFYNYDNLKNNNVRAKAGNEKLFEWATELLNKARAQKQLTHAISLSAKTIELKDNGNGKYEGKVKVYLTNCNGGYKVTDSTVTEIQKLGGTITGIKGSNGGTITVSLPQKGNANKAIKLSVVGLDSRVSGNFIFAEPNRSEYPQTGNTGGSKQRMIAIFENKEKATEASAQMNTPKSSKVTVIKIDAETGNIPQGDANLKNVEFKITAAEDIANTAIKAGDTIVSGLKSGEKIELFPGKYQIYEMKSPLGYVKSEMPKTVTVSEAGKTYAFTFENAVIKRPISIVKFLGDDSPDSASINKPQTPEQGAEFQIILKSSGKIMATITTDEFGCAKTNPLPYGIYVIHQTKGKEGYTLLEDTDVVIDENLPDSPYQLIVDDHKERMSLRIVKVDAETGRKIIIPGAKFKIKDADGNVVSQTIHYPQTQSISEWVTDSSGTVQLPYTLAYGKYSLVELESPAGYCLNNDEIHFTVSKANASINDPLYVEVIMKNAPIKGRIHIDKTGDAFCGVKKTETDYGDIFTPEFKKTSLSGAVFDILANEDIIVNGEIKISAGTIVDTVTTANNGADSKELYLGKYKIVERQSPMGYLCSNKEKIITIASEGQNTPVVEAEVEFKNDYQGTQIDIAKEAEVIMSEENDGTISTKINVTAGKGFVFGLYTDEDIYAADRRTMISKDSLVAFEKTDENGKLSFLGKYPHGKYYVKEIYTNSAYERNDTKYPVDLSYNKELDRIYIDMTALPILNKIIQVPMTITKYDITGKQTVPGTMIEVYDEDGNIIYKNITKEDGAISDILVEKGHSYTFKEVLSAEGYALNTAVFRFEVTDNGEIVGDTVIKDDYSCFELLKTDTNGNPVSGCTFGMYDINDQLIMTAISDENGIVKFEPLPFGKFYIKEIQTTEEYQLSDRVITIDVTGRWVNSDTPVVFENQPVIKTGAASGQITYAVIIGISVCVILGWHISKKKKHKNA